MKKISLKQLKLKKNSLLLSAEKRQIFGGYGASLIGVEWREDGCFCDWLNPDDLEPICGMRCNSYYCAQAFPDKGIPF